MTPMASSAPCTRRVGGCSGSISARPSDRPGPMGMSLRYLWAGLGLMLGACAQTPPPASVAVPDSACRTASVMLAFDFDGASPARCAVTGERAFTLLISPEHAPPINPSPWYAFRYKADGTAPVSVTLRYLGAAHRYAPKWHSGDATRDLPVTVSAEGAAASMELPAGEAIVSAQE